MLDIQLLRNNIDEVSERLSGRGYTLDVATFQKLEAERKTLQTRTQDLQASRNSLSKQIGQLKGKGEDASGVMAEVAKLKEELEANEARLGDLLQERIQLARSFALIERGSQGDRVLQLVQQAGQLRGEVGIQHGQAPFNRQGEGVPRSAGRQ